MNNDIAIIGVGNEFRDDDAAGLMVARALKGQAPETVSVFEQSGEATALMDVMSRFANVILVDALQSSAPPGTVHCLDVNEKPFPVQLLRCSTHNLSVGSAIELLRALGKLPARVRVYGIEGKTFDPGTTVSEEVLEANDRVVESILEDVRNWISNSPEEV